MQIPRIKGRDELLIFSVHFLTTDKNKISLYTVLKINFVYQKKLSEQEARKHIKEMAENGQIAPAAAEMHVKMQVHRCNSQMCL